MRERRPGPPDGRKGVAYVRPQQLDLKIKIAREREVVNSNF